MDSIINNMDNNSFHEEFLEKFYETLHYYELAIKDKYNINIIKYKDEIEILVQSNLVIAYNQYGNVWDGFIRTYEETLEKTEYNLTNALKYFINNSYINNKIKKDRDFIKYKLFFINN